MSKLTSKGRNALSAKDFSGPDRSYPINDPNHAMAAQLRDLPRGVHRNRRGKLFRAVIKVAGKCIHLGNADTADEAGSLYMIAAKKHFGEFARSF